jgi:hypothetical protein
MWAKEAANYPHQDDGSPNQMQAPIPEKYRRKAEQLAAKLQLADEKKVGLLDVLADPDLLALFMLGSAAGNPIVLPQKMGLRQLFKQAGFKNTPIKVFELADPDISEPEKFAAVERALLDLLGAEEGTTTKLRELMPEFSKASTPEIPLGEIEVKSVGRDPYYSAYVHPRTGTIHMSDPMSGTEVETLLHELTHASLVKAGAPRPFTGWTILPQYLESAKAISSVPYKIENIAGNKDVAELSDILKRQVARQVYRHNIGELLAGESERRILHPARNTPPFKWMEDEDALLNRDINLDWIWW